MRIALAAGGAVVGRPVFRYCEARVMLRIIKVSERTQVVALLRRAVRRGETGDVPYSARALAVLREQLRERMKGFGGNGPQ